MRNKRVSDFSILESLVQHKKIGRGVVFMLIEIVIELNDCDPDIKTQSSCNKLFNSGSDVFSFENKEISDAFNSHPKTAACS